MEAALATRIQALGRAPYGEVCARMREFTRRRDAHTPDELWVVEHPPVYTLGQGADPKFGPKQANGIALVRAERGGEITYHGPGQAVLYALVDLQRRGIRVKEFVRLLEQAVIDLLAGHGVDGARRAGAPGVYVGGAKVAALGLRVRGGCTYHGLALNVDLDLAPYRDINPCGYEGLAVTRLADLGVALSRERAQDALARAIGDLWADGPPGKG
jgi:lipoyl(octanoyl) transferase